MSMIQDVVTFDADGALYAVPVGRVQEILDLRPTAAMPNAPAYLLGIIDLRGANIPVVDLRQLLGRVSGEDTAQTRILVVSVTHRGGQVTIGVKTDRVIEVTQPTYHRWRQQYGGMQAEEARRLTQLEKENARLKKLLAEAELEKAMLKDLAEGNF